MALQHRPARQEARNDPGVRGRRRARPGHRDPGGPLRRRRQAHARARRLLGAGRSASTRSRCASPPSRSSATFKANGASRSASSARSASTPTRSTSTRSARCSAAKDVFQPMALRRRRGHVQGQGLPGRHQAAPHEGHPRDPRYARVLPPRRLDRLPPHPAARPQGQAHGGPDGQREEDRPEPPALPDPRRGERHPRPRRGPGRGERATSS